MMAADMHTAEWNRDRLELEFAAISLSFCYTQFMIITSLS